MALLSDNQGGVWLGTWLGGVAYLKKEGSWLVFNTDNSNLPDIHINALISDEQGGVWVGTEWQGIAHLTFGQKNTLCTDLNEAQCQNVPGEPILNQAVSHDGDMFKVTLPPLPAGQVQYVGVALPDSSIFVLGYLNAFAPFDNATLPVWQGSETAMEVPLSGGIPRGDYVVYLLRMPVGVEPLANPEQWALGVSTFKVE